MQLDWLSSKPRDPLACLPSLGLQVNYVVLDFIVALEIQTQILMLAWETLYQGSHLPGAYTSLHTCRILREGIWGWALGG